MIKYNFIVLLIIHVLCDFYFQSEKVAANKQKKFVWVVLHSILYALPAMIFLIIIMPGLPMRYLICFLSSHAVLDIGKYAICNCKSVKGVFWKEQRNLFIIDQTLHVLVILAIVYFLRGFEMNALYNSKIENVFDTFGISETILLIWIIKILLIHKPINIFIVNVLYKYKPDNKNQINVSDKNAGRFIGTLERIIMTIFISLNQYSAVGLVLTAKSIARYDKISKEQEFAEYYLLGTLLSTICSICVSIIF